MRRPRPDGDPFDEAIEALDKAREARLRLLEQTEEELVDEVESLRRINGAERRD